MQEFFIAAKDGVRTYVLNLKPEKPSNKPPVFLIHGLTRNHRDFSPIFDFLLGLGHEIYAIDVRGRGKSDYDSNAANYNPLIYCYDVIEIFEQLKIPPAIFIGTSMGGIISMLLASFKPELFAGIILNDVGPAISLEGIKRIRGYVGNVKHYNNIEEAIEAVKGISLYAFPDKVDDDSFWRGFAERITKPADGGFVLDYDPRIKESIVAADPDAPPADIWAQFALGVNIPTYLIKGELSDIINQEITEKMQEVNPNLVVHIVQNIGHAPILNEPEALNAIKEFSDKFA